MPGWLCHTTANTITVTFQGTFLHNHILVNGNSVSHHISSAPLLNYIVKLNCVKRIYFFDSSGRNPVHSKYELFFVIVNYVKVKQAPPVPQLPSPPPVESSKWTSLVFPGYLTHVLLLCQVQRCCHHHHGECQQWHALPGQVCGEQ